MRPKRPNPANYFVLDEQGAMERFDTKEEAITYMENYYPDNTDGVHIIKGKELIFHEERTKLKITIDD